ncbi:MAG: ABC transporter substrate-binding protein [Labedaea sp.]
MTGLTVRRRTALLAAALTVVLTAAGCGDAVTPASGANPLLTVYNGASGQFTLNFNPFAPVPLGPTRGMIYETLMFVNLAKASDVRPHLAESYEWGSDGKSLTFTIRKGVKWSDGKPLTADDVAFVFNLNKDNAKVNTASVPYAGATATDETHVTVTFTRAAYTYFWYVAGKTFIVPKHIWTGVADPATDTNGNPVGSGPYKVKQFSAQSIDLEKNPDYWQAGKPKINNIRFVSFTGNEAALNGLLANQIDWEGGFIADIDKVYVARNPSANKYLNTPQFITVFVANLDQGPASDPAVRKAIYAAIDRDQVNKLSFSGYDTPASPGLLLQPRDQKWATSDVPASTPAPDPAKAEDLLKQAGYAKGGDGIYAGSKGKLSIKVKVVSGYSDWISALQVMKQQLAKIGIELQPQEESKNAYDTDMENGTFDMVVTNIYGGPEPYYLYNDFLNSANTKPVGQRALHNFARFRSAAVDQALVTIGATNDEATKKQAYATIQREAAGQLPYIPIGQSSTLTEFNGGKFKGWPTMDNLYALPMPFTEPDLGIVVANLEPA